MAESTCLHIQDHESGPIRIVEIPWISVRIGRAAFCEVRLTDPALPDEACRLHRRGRTWYLTPVAPGAAVVDGRPLDAARPLPFDAPFHVGPYLLALKRNKFAEPDWRPARAAQAAEAPAAPRPKAEDFSPRPRRERPAAPASAGAWEARWEAAGDRLKAPKRAPTPSLAPAPAAPAPAPAPPRAEGYAPTRPAPAAPGYSPASPTTARYEPVGFAPRPVPTPRPAPAPVHRPTPVSPFTAAPAASPRPAPAPAPRVEVEAPARIEDPVAAPVAGVESEAPPSFFDSMADPVAWAAEAPAVADAPEAEPEGVAPFDDVEDEATEAEGEPAVEAPSLCEIAPIAETPSLFEAAPVEEETAPVDVEPTPEAPPLCESATTTDAPSMYEAAPVAEGPSLFDAPSMYETAPIGEAPSLFDAPSLYEAAPVAEGPSLFDAPAKPAEPPRAERPAEEAASRGVAPAGVPGEGDERVRNWARDEADRLDRQERGERREQRPAGPPPGVALRIDRAHRGDDEAEGERFDPTRSQRSREGRRPAEPALPSVQDVLAASQWARRAPTPSPAPHKPTPRPKPKAAPSPTTAVAPSQWSLPSWLTWPPATFLTLTVGASFTLCSWWWAVDSRNAAIAGQAALALRQGTAKDRPLPKGVAPPPTSWWRTTPLHLAQWSAYLGATRTEQGWTETPADLIADAAAISPVNAVARLAKARMDRTGPGADADAGADDPREDLGLSRDAVSLAWTAQRLHKAGKDEAAVRTYRRALEIAERSGFEHEEPLVFSDDPAAPRYLLPGEKLAGSIIAELIADSSWTYREWSAAIPRGAVAALVAAKGLKEQGRLEADQALADLASALRLDDGPGREGEDDDRPASARAVDHAVAAEALAMKASWKDAQQQYKAAIGLMVDAKVKRSWWFNLADVAARLNDEDQRRRALDEVLVAEGGDEVSRRALDVQRAGRP